MKNTAKTRLYLFIGSSITIVMVAAFLVILNINEPKEYTEMPFNVLWILTVIACISMALFFARGPVFDIGGKLEQVNINAMLMTVLIVIQLSFFFEIISVRYQIINYQLYESIRQDFSIACECEEEELNDVLGSFVARNISAVSIVNEEKTVLYSSNKESIGQTLTQSKYCYPFENNTHIQFEVDTAYISKQIRDLILNLVTVLVTSIFFSVEIILLVIRIISRNAVAILSDEDIEGKEDEEDNGKMLSSLYYIRQISFLFYFASRLSSAFIPIMAKSLHNPMPWISDTAAAGIPQSAETLLTCSAIFLTTMLLEKKGWKLPFIWGLIMVAAGTFMSAVSGNLIIFVIARAVVGLGYGFCWMTLRNLSLFGKNAKEQMLGFALLNAGIYAGMNCGASLGAILAEIYGYKIVFIISAIMTIMSSMFILKMENAILPKHTDEAAAKVLDNIKIQVRDKIIAVLFVVLLIAPTSIAASYLSYYMPLYFESIGKSVTDVGRAQLLYGLVIVYAGPALAALISRLKGNMLGKVTVFYNILVALSLFIAGMGSGIFLPFMAAALLGTADSFGFGIQNNAFLSLPAVIKLGGSRSLSVLSFVKKMLEMIGPFVFAAAIVVGYQAGIRVLAICFAVMAVLFVVCILILNRESVGGID